MTLLLSLSYDVWSWLPPLAAFFGVPLRTEHFSSSSLRGSLCCGSSRAPRFAPPEQSSTYLPGSVPVRYTVAKTECRASSLVDRPLKLFAPGLIVFMFGLAVSTQAVSRWPASAAIADVLPASCRTPIVTSKPRPWIMCSSLCLFKGIVSCACFLAK